MARRTMEITVSIIITIATTTTIHLILASHSNSVQKLESLQVRIRVPKYLRSKLHRRYSLISTKIKCCQMRKKMIKSKKSRKSSRRILRSQIDSRLRFPMSWMRVRQKQSNKLKRKWRTVTVARRRQQEQMKIRRLSKMKMYLLQWVVRRNPSRHLLSSFENTLMDQKKVSYGYIWCRYNTIHWFSFLKQTSYHTFFRPFPNNFVFLSIYFYLQ